MHLFLLLFAAQAPDTLAQDLRALDEAHETWMRCVLQAAHRLAVGSQDESIVREAAYRVCAREEAGWRSALAPLHPDASPADLADSVAGSKRPEAFYVSAVIAEARRR